MLRRLRRELSRPRPKGDPTDRRSGAGARQTDAGGGQVDVRHVEVVQVQAVLGGGGRQIVEL